MFNINLNATSSRLFLQVPSLPTLLPWAHPTGHLHMGYRVPWLWGELSLGPRSSSLGSLLDSAATSQDSSGLSVGNTVVYRHSEQYLYKGHIHFNLLREDNLSIMDKMAGPKCVHYLEVSLYKQSFFLL